MKNRDELTIRLEEDLRVAQGLEKMAMEQRDKAFDDLALDRGYLISCPWCAAKMNGQPISMQMSHVISCGDRRIGEERSRMKVVAWRYRYANASARKGEWKYVDNEDECNSAPEYQREPVCVVEGYARAAAPLNNPAFDCPHTWNRTEPQPAKFTCSCGTIVYRSYEDKVND